MRNLLVISEKYHPYGGAELATHLILKMLKKEDLNLTVVTGARNIQRIEGVRYIYVPLLDVSTKIHLWKNLFLIRNFLIQFIKKHDMVYIPRLSYPIIEVSKKLGKKVIVHLHDYQPISYEAICYPYERNRKLCMLLDILKTARVEVLEHGSISRVLISSLLTSANHLSRLWLFKADEIICVSNRHAEIIVKALPELARKVKVIHNPLPEVPLINKEYLKKTAFLYVGGDRYLKGFNLFLRASMRLLHMEGNVKFILTGKVGDRWRKLFDILNKKIRNSYKVLGHVSRESLLKLYSESYALLFPSIWEEPLPYAVLESMLAGTIPIASRVGGVPEIVQGTYAEKMLFEAGNVDELVDRIESVLAMSNKQIIDAGFSLRETVLKRYNPEVVKRDLIKVFSV
jgi:glycosyltransferase involved in cell wall biosynthesis